MENKGDIRGVSICQNRPKLTNLLFADDNLIFCRPKTEECAKLLEILATYERASSQQINRDKTTLFFSKAVPQVMQETIISMIGVPEIKQYEKYLGFPSFVGRSKKANLLCIKERVW